MNTADLRRAVALIQHYSRADIEGMNAILQEADESKRLSDLLLAVLGLFRQVSPDLFTPEAQERLNSAVLILATQENPEAG